MAWRLGVEFAVFIVVLGGALFWAAGTLDWWGGWVFLGEMVLGAGGPCIWLLRHDPGLLRERRAGGFQTSQVSRDKLLTAVLQIGFFAWLILMALDAERWRLSHVPSALEAVGAILSATFFPACWLVFRENSFAAPVVKIQEERGQSVITTGPYHLVRHPMYAGAIPYFIGLPLLFGSWLGFALAPLFIALLVARIPIEERALRDGLVGYDAYVAQVRWRLVPGLW